MIKRILGALALLVCLLLAVVAVNTWRQSSLQRAVNAVAPVPVNADAAARRLAGTIPFRTISSADDASLNDVEFDKLQAYLSVQFPRVHAALKREVVGHKALLYTWVGSDPAAKPIALMAHQDVVPIAPGTEKDWTEEPFSGALKDGIVWGRGTMDDKGNLVSQLEAVEMLLTSGFKPRQTVYLVMGADEEVLGLRGAAVIAALLKSRGVQLAWVLDEGLSVVDGIIKGLPKPVALIGLAEKGYATFTLSYDTTPGHSSMPPVAGSAIGTVSRALARLEAEQMPAGIKGVIARMFTTLAPEMTLTNRVLLSNLWLTEPLVVGQLEKVGSTNATLRTTTALTIVAAGNKENVLPGHAEGTVNFRVMPGDTLASVEAHVRKVIDNEAIKIKREPGASEPSPVSSPDAAGYSAIEKAVRQTFPDVVVAPGLMTAATDSRYLGSVSDAVYRFSPFRLTPADLGRFHGTNERLPISQLVEMIQFYHRLLQNTAATADAS